MSEKTRQHLDTFWELLDEILNALLFVLIGLEILVLTITRQHFIAGSLAIPALLAARWLSVIIPVSFLQVDEILKGNRGRISLFCRSALFLGKARHRARRS